MSATRRGFLRTTVGLTASVAVTGAATTAGRAVAAPAASPAAVPPQVAGCDAWAARPPSVPVTLLDSRPHKIIVHHTASANSTDYSRQHAYALARSIQNHHMDTNGWIDSGQHFTVTRGGLVLEGRHRSVEALASRTRHVVGAHCTGQNTVAIGIENEGTYTATDLRPAHYAALLDLCTYLCTQYGLRAYQIYGHRELNATTCPGDRLYAQLARLRADVAARVGGDPAPPAWPLVRRGESGERVRSVQYLLRQHGAALAADGVFGPATESAVRSFQTASGADVDGVVGRQTWNQSVLPLARGAAGEAVRAVQSQLTAHGIATAVDGAFGPGTESGVRRFQNGRSLPADGVVDARTWSRLVT